MKSTFQIILRDQYLTSVCILKLAFQSEFHVSALIWIHDERAGDQLFSH